MRGPDPARPSGCIATGVLIALVAATALPFASAGDATDLGLPASVAPADPPTDIHSYPAVDAQGDPVDPVRWRVVEDTGNCCENYLTVAPSGRLVDIGGTYPHFTDDAGRTWYRVEPPQKLLVGGEGAAVTAPNGDILIVEWDVYGGDHLVAFKYDASEDTWRYAENPVHQPFYDRPWLAVAPGPTTAADTTEPYTAIVKGGLSTELYGMSPDGLNYELHSSKAVDDRLTAPETAWLDQPARPAADWDQPHTISRITPLPSGGALTADADFFTLAPCDWSKLGDALRWHCFRTPDGLPADRLLVDSEGRLHRLAFDGPRRSLDYAISSDGGRTWQTTTLDLPEPYVIDDPPSYRVDFKVNANVGIAAVAVHANDTETGMDQDFVFEVDVSQAVPAVARIDHVGAGDVEAGIGLGGTNRMDFPTVGILPSGRIVTSTIDSVHENPSVAIQVDPPSSVESTSSAGSSPDPVSAQDRHPGFLRWVGPILTPLWPLLT